MKLKEVLRTLVRDLCDQLVTKRQLVEGAYAK